MVNLMLLVNGKRKKLLKFQEARFRTHGKLIVKKQAAIKKEFMGVIFNLHQEYKKEYFLLIP